MIDFFVHPLADCQSKSIGFNTKIWQFSVVLPGAVIGKNCNINSHCFIENDVYIGDNVTIKCGCYIWNGMRIEDDVFIGPNTTFTNDKRPQSRAGSDRYLKTIIKSGASIGAGCVVLPGLTIGRRALIGAGTLITKDVPDSVTVYGNPARICAANTINGFLNQRKCAMSLQNCRIVELPKIEERRGNLTFVEAGKHIPFDIKRVYYLYDVPGGASRAAHGHKKLHQLMVAMSGSFDITLDDGFEKKLFHLNRSYFWFIYRTDDMARPRQFFIRRCLHGSSFRLL